MQAMQVHWLRYTKGFQHPKQENISDTDILYQDTDGGQISVDGKIGSLRQIMRKTTRYRMCSGGQLMNMRRG